MDATELAALNTVLDRQVAAGNALLVALESERAALTGFDLPALEAATTNKERAAADFDRLDADRRRLVARFGFGPGRLDMVELIRAVEDRDYKEDARRTGPVATRWRRIISLAERCRDANARNGQIVSLQSRRVTKTLNILRTGRPDELTYGPAGAAGVASAARALGRV